jgi:septal ring factor EnvC (AmiA/AmiB activator)
MRTTRLIRWIGTLLAALFLSWPAAPQETSHYTRFRDAKWYAIQLQSLQEEVAKIDTDLRTLVEARKSGKGITDAVALDQEPEGVTSDAQMDALRKRRVVVLRQIDALEEQARHNAIAPGDLRTEYGAEVSETISGRKLNRETKELENALAQEKERLEHARKDAELLRRDQKLKAQQEYSNPESPSRRNKPSELMGLGNRLAEKEAEVQEAEQKLTDLEDRLEDLRRNSESQPETDTPADAESTNLKSERHEKNEADWRKQFAEIDYKVRTAETELDILQRELNLGSVQYYPNPSTAMKESVTRKEINEHRKAIEEKKKEIAKLKKQRDDLEDALRHAGGPAGWAR